MTASTPTHRGWFGVDASSDPGWYVRFLERSRQNQIMRIEKDRARELAFLRLAPGLKVLDVGCGIGNLTRTFAPLLAPGGELTGVDLSERMIAIAQRETRPVATVSIDFRVGSATTLPFPDGGFDRVSSNIVLEHLPDPAGAIREMHRVAAPGGWLIVGDLDQATHTIATGDPEIDRRLVDAFCAEIRHPWAIRDVPTQFRELGLEEMDISAQTTVIRTEGEQGFLPVLDDFLAAEVEAGRFQASEAKAIAARLRERLDDGCYFESYTVFRVSGRVPLAPSRSSRYASKS
ncbi:MAG: methyltransferase domain-containing protein [Thermoplasmata archaeon]